MDNSEKASKIRLLIVDIDGVMTNGKIYTGATGEMFKAFDVKDGLGLKMLMRNGISVAVITAKSSAIVAQRMAGLGVEDVFQGVSDKAAKFHELIAAKGLAPEECAYIGDDLPDIAVMALVGLSAAPSDATELIRERADIVSTKAGGAGCVREIAEFILKSQSLYEKTLEAMFFHPDTASRFKY